MSKRNSGTAENLSSNKRSKTNGEDVLALDKWRVVLTGEFPNKSLLEASLKEKKVKITQAVSGKTTHLILGESGVNDYGKKTGLGSSKHQAAVEKNLPILKEPEVLGILNGTITETDLAEAKERTKVKAKKSSPLSVKVIFCIQETGLDKVSLVRLKKELGDRFEMSFHSTRSKNALKKALGACLEDGKLRKEGVSYGLAESQDLPNLPTGDSVQWSNEAKAESRAADIDRLSPEEGRWRGLYVLEKKVSKSGRAKCGGCDQFIAKGEQQIKVSDDSLFKMMVFPGDHHEGVSRGYVECGYPGGFDVVGRKSFFVHAGCKDTAEEQCKAQFEKDWKKVRKYVIRDRF